MDEKFVFTAESQFIQTKNQSDVRTNEGDLRRLYPEKMETNGIGGLPHLSQSFQLRSDGKCHSSAFHYCLRTDIFQAPVLQLTHILAVWF